MAKNTIVGIVVAGLIVIIAVLWYLSFRGGRSSVYNMPTPTPFNVFPTEEQKPTATKGAELPTTSISGQATVEVSSTGFSPASVTISVGGKVEWKNIDSDNHQIASDPHPVHTDYPPLNLGLIKPGEVKSLIFDKAGTYKYHDHLNPSFRGTVYVSK